MRAAVRRNRIEINRRADATDPNCPFCRSEMFFDSDTLRWLCRSRFDGEHGRQHFEARRPGDPGR